jgi:hypothetical protein
VRVTTRASGSAAAGSSVAHAHANSRRTITTIDRVVEKGEQDESGPEPGIDPASIDALATPGILGEPRRPIHDGWRPGRFNTISPAPSKCCCNGDDGAQRICIHDDVGMACPSQHRHMHVSVEQLEQEADPLSIWGVDDAGKERPSTSPGSTPKEIGHPSSLPGTDVPGTGAIR